MPQTGEKWANVLRRGHVPKSVVSPTGDYQIPGGGLEKKIIKGGLF